MEDITAREDDAFVRMVVQEFVDAGLADPEDDDPAALSYDGNTVSLDQLYDNETGDAVGVDLLLNGDFMQHVDYTYDGGTDGRLVAEAVAEQLNL